MLLPVLRYLQCEDWQALPVFGWVGIPRQPRSLSVSTILSLHTLSLVAYLCPSLPALECARGHAQRGEEAVEQLLSAWPGWLTCIFPSLCQQMQGCEQI